MAQIPPDFVKLHQSFVDFDRHFADFSKRVKAKDQCEKHEGELQVISYRQKDLLQTFTNAIDRQPLSDSDKATLSDKKVNLLDMGTKIDELSSLITYRNSELQFTRCENRFKQNLETHKASTTEPELKALLDAISLDLQAARQLKDYVNQVRLRPLTNREILDGLSNLHAKTDDLIRDIEKEVKKCTGKIQFLNSDFPELTRRFNEINDRIENAPLAKSLQDATDLLADIRIVLDKSEIVVSPGKVVNLRLETEALKTEIEEKLKEIEYDNLLRRYNAINDRIDNETTVESLRRSLQNATDLSSDASGVGSNKAVNLRIEIDGLKTKIEKKLEGIEDNDLLRRYNAINDRIPNETTVEPLKKSLKDATDLISDTRNVKSSRAANLRSDIDDLKTRITEKLDEIEFNKLNQSYTTIKDRILNETTVDPLKKSLKDATDLLADIQSLINSRNNVSAKVVNLSTNVDQLKKTISDKLKEINPKFDDLMLSYKTLTGRVTDLTRKVQNKEECATHENEHNAIKEAQSNLYQVIKTALAQPEHNFSDRHTIILTGAQSDLLNIDKTITANITPLILFRNALAELKNCQDRFSKTRTDHKDAATMSQLEAYLADVSKDLQAARQLKGYLSQIKRTPPAPQEILDGFPNLEANTDTLIGDINKLKKGLIAEIAFLNSPYSDYETDFNKLKNDHKEYLTKLSKDGKWNEFTLEDISNKTQDALASLEKLEAKIEARKQQILSDHGDFAAKECAALNKLSNQITNLKTYLKPIKDHAISATNFLTSNQTKLDKIEKDFNSNVDQYDKTKKLGEHRIHFDAIKADLAKAQELQNEILEKRAELTSTLSCPTTSGKIVNDLTTRAGTVNSLVDKIRRKKEAFEQSINSRTNDINHLTALEKKIEQALYPVVNSATGQLLSAAATRIGTWAYLIEGGRILYSGWSSTMLNRVRDMAQRRENGEPSKNPGEFDYGADYAEEELYKYAIGKTDRTFTRLMREEYEPHEGWANDHRPAKWSPFNTPADTLKYRLKGLRENE